MPPYETHLNFVEPKTKEPEQIESQTLKLKRDKPLQRAASKLEQALGIKSKAPAAPSTRE